MVSYIYFSYLAEKYLVCGSGFDIETKDTKMIT